MAWRFYYSMSANQEISEHPSEDMSERPSESGERHMALHNHYDELESSHVDEEEEVIDAMPPKRAPTPLVDHQNDDEGLVMPQKSRQKESREGNRQSTPSQAQQHQGKSRRRLQQKTSIMEVYNLDDEEEKVETKIIHQSTIARPALFLRDDPEQSTEKKPNGARLNKVDEAHSPRADEEVMENKSNVKLFKKSEAETTTVQLKQKEHKKQQAPAVIVEPVPAPETHIKEHHDKRFEDHLKLSKGLMKRESSGDIYDYYYAAPDPLDSGLKVNGSLPSSRDQLSTRAILASDPKSRKRLAPLQPYKDSYLNESKDVLTLPQYKQETSSSKADDDTTDHITFTKFRQGRAVIPDEAIKDTLTFIKSTIPHGQLLECNLRRNKTCSKRFFLDFDLTSEEGKFLLSVKKMAFRCQSTYHLSLFNGDYEQKSNAFLGKVQGNFSGSMFNLYTTIAGSHLTSEVVATIVYTSKCFCCDLTTREVEVYVKDNAVRYYELQGTEFEEGRNLKELYEIESNRREGKIKRLVSKQPRWNNVSNAWSMNFHGRSKYGSVKNMILLEDGRRSREALLIAKQGDNDFALDIGHPLSPMVGLGIVITSFDFKLATQ